LQALARPNDIVICPGTLRLVRDLFEFDEIGAVELKGFPEPVSASRVVRESTVESRVEALHARQTPIVGREEELDMLVRRWRQAKSGEGRVVLVSGEPGIGKSRLTAALQEHLKGEPHFGVRYFCSPQHQGSALQPVIAQLKAAAGFSREDTSEAQIAKLEALLTQTSDDVAATTGTFADLLGIPADGRYPPLHSEPQRRRQQSLRANDGETSESRKFSLTWA
jgi:nucleoside-triphosphatase THEP1